MAIYQNAERNKILLNAYGVVIDPSLILCYDAGNPYSFVDPHRGTGVSTFTETVYDLSTVANNGTIIHYLDDITTGSNGGVFTFQGSGNTQMSTGTPSIIASFNATPLSVSIWVKPLDTAGTTTQMDIITNRNSTSGTNTARGVYLTTARQIALNIASTVVGTGAYVVPNEWYHITFVHSSTNLRCYVNSILRYTKGSASGGTGAAVGIGTNINLLQYFLYGQIGLPMIYNKELSQAEITQNYTSQAARFGLTDQTLPPLKLYFDPGSTNSYTGSIPTKIYDLSGNNYTGSLSASNATTAQRPVYSSAGGGSLFFNGTTAAGGSGSYIGGFVSGSSAIGPINTGNTYTIDTWINNTALNGIWIGTAGATPYQHYINAGDNTNNIGGTSNTFQANMVINTWYNLVTVRDGDAMWCYLNGVLIATTLNSYVTGNGTANLLLTRIGNRSTDFYARGYLGAFKIYSGTLTGIQVYNNFQATRARYGI